MSNKFDGALYLVEALEPGATQPPEGGELTEGKIYSPDEVSALEKDYEYMKEIGFLDDNVYIVFADFNYTTVYGDEDPYVRRRRKAFKVPEYITHHHTLKVIDDNGTCQEVTDQSYVKVLLRLTMESAEQDLECEITDEYD